ncbi:MAG: protein phosphatase 2C domain-containing protein [Thermodesulfobacteriota bacterium]
MRFESWSKTDVGLVRETNQDHVGCYPELGLFVVADGMGGHADGEIASRIAVETLRDAYAGSDETQPGRTMPTLPAMPSGPLAWLARFTRGRAERRDDADTGERDVARLEAAVQDANRRIFDLGHEGGGPATRAMGTTVIALVAPPSQRRVAWAHVGDSRLYRLRDGALELLTADHTRFGEPYRTAGAVPLDLPHTNQLVLALGVERSVPVAVGSDVVRPGDVFLLASDGVTGLVAPERIVQILRDMRSPAEAGEELMRLALEAGGTDNATAVVLRAVE